MSRLDDDQLDKILKIILACFIFTGLLMVLIFPLMCINTIDEAYVGVGHDNFYEKTVPEVLMPGQIHMLTPYSYVQEFPAKIQNIELTDFVCLAADGTEPLLDVLVQYKYSPNAPNEYPADVLATVESLETQFPFQYYDLDRDLPPLVQAFHKFGNHENLNQQVTLMAQNSIRDACSNFTSETFLQRAAVERKMQHFMESDFQDYPFIALGIVQVKNVDLNQEFAVALRSKQSAFEQKSVELSARDKLIISAQQALLVAETEALATVNQAREDKIAREFQADQQFQGEMAKWIERQAVWNRTYHSLGMANFGELVDYLTALEISKAKNPIVGVGTDVQPGS